MYKEESSMYRKLINTLTLATTTMLVAASLALAAPTVGTVTNVNDKGMATVRTEDGKEHQVKASQGLKVGTRVQCETKNGQLECQPARS
jgi:hypothetical protein